LDPSLDELMVFVLDLEIAGDGLSFASDVRDGRFEWLAM